MRIIWLLTAGSLLAVPPLYCQAVIGAQVQIGISTERTRELNSLSELGSEKGDASKLARTLTFEETDDPTVGGKAIPKHDPAPAARKAAQKAEHLAKKGRHDEAVALFRQALEIDPQYYEAGNNLALELEAAGRAEEAEQTLRGLTKSAPEHVLAFTNLATLLRQQYRYGDAEGVMREALRRHPFSFKTNMLLGAALVDQGHYTEEARAKLEYAQVKYPAAKDLLSKWPVKAASNSAN